MEEGKDKETATIEAIAAYAIEAAALKVFGSESLDYVVDEYVQTLGGMGFSAETNADRAYRDSRINRIFEGTNEINRILVTDTTIKKSLKTGFDVSRYAESIVKNQDEASKTAPVGDYFAEKRFYVENFKKVALFVMGVMSDKFEKKFLTEQEILMNISDIITMVYAAESTMLRVEKLAGMKGDEAVKLQKDILDIYVFDSACDINKRAMDAICSFVEGDELTVMIDRIKQFTTVAPINVKEARRRIANTVIEENTYCF
jgi:hypothetical protein